MGDQGIAGDNGVKRAPVRPHLASPALSTSSLTGSPCISCMLAVALYKLPISRP